MRTASAHALHFAWIPAFAGMTVGGIVLWVPALRFAPAGMTSVGWLAPEIGEGEKRFELHAGGGEGFGGAVEAVDDGDDADDLGAGGAECFSCLQG